MSDLTRREALGLMASIPLASTLEFAPQALERASRAAERALGVAGYAPTFFTPHEWDTVRVLVDLVIPRDARSGSATDAGVPEFMDFILTEYPDQQLRMRGGLAWLDRESRHRFEHPFVELTPAQQASLLDDIAFPAHSPPELSQGVAFFTRFRDMTASGFFSSRMGVEDLQYLGNRPQVEWNGCPPEALRKLGVSY